MEDARLQAIYRETSPRQTYGSETYFPETKRKNEDREKIVLDSR